MFYSHQLLARKAPLGQIWMAATLHAKINRRKLDKLNLINICEEILNPAVPMALRLSGILMGGVVIVYQRKVKLLYDDVHRLLVEINEAWKVKSSKADPTVLPKGRTQARYEAVTMQDDASAEMDSEQILHHSFTTGATEGFQSFFAMGLDRVSDTYIHINAGEDDVENNHQEFDRQRQRRAFLILAVRPNGCSRMKPKSIQQPNAADPENITLLDDYGSCMPETDPFSRFERFDTEGEAEIHFSITPEEPHVPTTMLPSPQKEPSKDFPLDDEFKGPEQEPQDEQDPNGFPEIPEEVGHNVHHKRPAKRKARATSANVIMDNELTIVPGHVYQSWLNDASDIVSTKGRRKKSINPISSMKMISFMELPPLVLLTGLNKVTGELHYPRALMELGRKSVQPKTANCSPSGRLSPAHTAAASSPPWPPERLQRQESQDPLEFPVEDFARGFNSHEMLPSIEKLRNNLGNLEQQALEAALRRNQFETPGSASDRSVPSIRSSGSGHSFPRMDVEVQLHSGRSQKRQQSSSKRSLGGLDPVEEEIPWEQSGRDPKLRRLNENGATPDLELLEETAPSPTPKRFYEPSMNEITRSIQTHLKLHFDTPGAPAFESLDQLTSGMNRRKAAQLFYQTCVLASADYLKVEQSAAYEDIYISRGPKM